MDAKLQMQRYQTPFLGSVPLTSSVRGEGAKGGISGAPTREILRDGDSSILGALAYTDLTHPFASQAAHSAARKAMTKTPQLSSTDRIGEAVGQRAAFLSARAFQHSARVTGSVALLLS